MLSTVFSAAGERLPFLSGAHERLDAVRRFVTRGPDHRERLADIDTRIVVSGTRGKSGTTERLHDVFDARGYDTGAKITGNRPAMLRGDERRPITRGERVTLYENERELRENPPDDVLVVENQAISDYTTRMVAEQFVDPDVVVLTNVRRDHLDTLGGDRLAIARALARAIPAGTHVVNGEQSPALRECLETELDRRGATVSHVSVPDEHANVPGAESIYALNEVLDAVGEEPLSRELLGGYLDEMRVEWRAIEGGHVFNAASVNDTESTEVVRRALAADRPGTIQPLFYIRGDRRGRTAAFLEYLSECYEQGVFEQVRVAGDDTARFARRAPFPVVRHDGDDPATVLDAALDDGWPVFLVGNTVADFMRGMEAEVERRAAAAESTKPSSSNVEATR
ncbi:Mur ligase family protein [Halomarina oriensis]|uniref:Mur ligase n=1 Tax=Halomarina oriensis TaxID=671145 RepID=A0A6B0GNY5_9EURY|nr:Mur ligase family protein [Halomarina oriensis]MWG36400.1 Mur ligase [Halomarina oriensis]